MDDLATFLKDWRVLAGFMAAPVPVVVAWLRLRERNWRHTARRSKAFRTLIRENSWREAPVLDFHSACDDAFGQTIEKVELAFIETRCRPLQMLRDRWKAGGNVRLNEKCSGYDDNRSGTGSKFKFRTCARFWTAASALFALLAAPLVLYSVSRPSWAFAPVIVEFGMAIWASIWFAQQMEAADRVTTLSAYPPSRPIPPELEPRKPSIERDKAESTPETQVGGVVKPPTRPRRRRSVSEADKKEDVRDAEAGQMPEPLAGRSKETVMRSLDSTPEASRATNRPEAAIKRG